MLLCVALLPGVAQAQELFVTSISNSIYSIYAYTTNGVQSTFATGLNSALYGLAIDSAGNVFVMSDDNNNWDIYKYAPNGSRSLFAANTGLHVPRGMAVDSAGNLYVADAYYSGYVNKFTTNGVQSTVGLSMFFYPSGLAFDGAGNLFVSDSTAPGGTIYKVTPDGTRSLFATNSGYGSNLACDSAGNVYSADGTSGVIYKYTANGVQSTFATGLSSPCGLACDPAGNLYAATGYGGIIEFTPGGTPSGFAPANMSWLVYPAFQPTPAPPASVPTLGICTCSNLPVVVWPASATNCVLQMTTNLASGNWVTVTNGILFSGLQITNAPPGAAFFRLH